MSVAGLISGVSRVEALCPLIGINGVAVAALVSSVRPAFAANFVRPDFSVNFLRPDFAVETAHQYTVIRLVDENGDHLVFEDGGLTA